MGRINDRSDFKNTRGYIFKTICMDMEQKGNT